MVPFIFKMNYLGFLHILKLILDMKQCVAGNKLNFDPCLGLSQLVEKFIFITLNSDHLVQAPQTVQTLHDFQLLPGRKCGLHFSGMFTTNQCCITSQNNKDLSPDFVQLLTFWVYLNISTQEEKDKHVMTQVRNGRQALTLSKIMNIHPWNWSIKYLRSFDNGHRKNILYGYKEYIMKSVQFKNYKLTFTVVQNIHPHRKVKSNVLHILYRGMNWKTALYNKN